MPNMFKCTLASGGALILTVTCDSAFAGQTITCTDGTTTLTQICPSTSPYTVEFRIPNGGNWTISGVISGTTVSESIYIPDSISLHVLVEVDIYSAAQDTIQIYNGSTWEVLCSTDSTGKSTSRVSLPIGTYQLKSSIAKNPNNLSDDYEKTITISANDTEVFLMPDGEVIYWYGFKGAKFKVMSDFSATGQTYLAPTLNTNNIYANGSANRFSGIYCNTKIPIGVTLKCIQNSSSIQTNTGLILRGVRSKSNFIDANNLVYSTGANTTGIKLLTVESITEEAWGCLFAINARPGYIYAFWYES